MLAFEEWMVRRPAVERWFRALADQNPMSFTLVDREGIARVLCSAYVRFFLAASGPTIPIARIDDEEVQVDGAQGLVDLVEWVCVRRPSDALAMLKRLEAFSAGCPPWAREVWADMASLLARAAAAVE